MPTHFGNIDRGSAPVAIFAGPTARERGFGAFSYDARSGFGSAYAAQPRASGFGTVYYEDGAGVHGFASEAARDAYLQQQPNVAGGNTATPAAVGGTDWSKVLGGVGSALANFFSPKQQTPQYPPGFMPGMGAGQYQPTFRPDGTYGPAASGMPSWALPVGGAVAAAVVLALLMSKKSRS